MSSWLRHRDGCFRGNCEWRLGDVFWRSHSSTHSEPWSDNSYVYEWCQRCDDGLQRCDELYSDATQCKVSDSFSNVYGNTRSANRNGRHKHNPTRHYSL